METTESNKSFSAIETILKVFTAPKIAFEAVRENPSWILPVAIYLAISVGFIFLTKDIIIQEAVKAQEEQMLERGMSQEDIDQSTAMMKKGMQFFLPISGVVFPLILLVVVAGISLFVGNVILGGQAAFKNVFAVTAYASLVTSLSALLSLPIILANQSMEVSFSLALLLPGEGEKSFLHRFLTHIDIFWIWWLAVQSIGLAVIYRMRTQRFAMVLGALFLAYALVSSGLATLFAQS